MPKLSTNILLLVKWYDILKLISFWIILNCILIDILHGLEFDKERYCLLHLVLDEKLRFSIFFRLSAHKCI